MSIRKEIDRFRAQAGLPPIIRKKTICLKCREEFLSRDYPKQRLCLKCRYDSEDWPTYSIGQDLMS